MTLSEKRQPIEKGLIQEMQPPLAAISGRWMLLSSSSTNCVIRCLKISKWIPFSARSDTSQKFEHTGLRIERIEGSIILALDNLPNILRLFAPVDVFQLRDAVFFRVLFEKRHDLVCIDKFQPEIEIQHQFHIFVAYDIDFLSYISSSRLKSKFLTAPRNTVSIHCPDVLCQSAVELAKRNVGSTIKILPAVDSHLSSFSPTASALLIPIATIIRSTFRQEYPRITSLFLD